MKVTSLARITGTAVSHNPAIRKHVLVGRDDIVGITNFSRAVFPVGECAPSHVHADMIEVFYIEQGLGEIDVDGLVVSLPSGSCITVEPGERHELRNAGDTEMVVIYFGVLANP